MSKSKLEEDLVFQIRACCLPTSVTQYRLPEIPERKHLWDFAFVEQRLLVDVQGGTWMPKGGHNTGQGIEDDCEKMALATMAGYRVMFVTGLQIKDGRAVEWIERALKV